MCPFSCWVHPSISLKKLGLSMVGFALSCKDFEKFKGRIERECSFETHLYKIMCVCWYVQNAVRQLKSKNESLRAYDGS